VGSNPTLSAIFTRQPRRMRDLAEVERSLLAPGGPFELTIEPVLGERMEVFAHRMRSLREMLASSRSHGQSEYVVCGDTRLTFQRHLEQVASLAGVLRDRYAIGKGDRVAILAENGPEWILAFWATVSLGAVAVALNGWWTADEIRFALGDAEPKLLVGDAKRLERLGDETKGVPVAEMEKDFAAWTSERAELPNTPIDEDDPACILYTSGTTGRPKGAVASHRSIIALTMLQFFHGYRTMLTAPPSAAPALPPCQLVTNPLFHVSGLYTGAVAMLAAGIKTVWTKGRFDAENILALIERERVTSWSPMGTMAYRVVTHPGVSRYDLSSLRSVGSGGAPMRVELQREIQRVFPHAAASLGLGYGLTESGALATIQFGKDLERQPHSAGRALPTVQIEIRDDAGRALPEGEEGEIHIRSPLVMLAYWRRSAETRESILPGRWLRTGDVGSLRDGCLTINSRKRDLILRGGENVYPAEIELRLEAHPDVDEAAVVGVYDAELGQAVAAIVVAKAGTAPTVDALQRWVAATLAYYKVPVRWEFRREPLPRNATGKVMKHLLEVPKREPRANET
jgi:long-chain acyl-CoA synthetase